jgi:hypothetical protein
VNRRAHVAEACAPPFRAGRDHPLHTFIWHGLAPSAGFVTGRLMLLAAFCYLAVVPAAWFGRFDPARGRPHGGPTGAGKPFVPLAEVAMPAEGAATALRQKTYRPLPPGGNRPGAAFGRLLAGEARILVQGIPGWWWLVAATVNVTGLAVPATLVKPGGDSTALLLSAAWIWPVLIWSRLGTQRGENGVDTLLGYYPGACRQLAAEWLAGLALTAATGLGPLIRMAIAADGSRVAAWSAGALFIPSLALLLGHRQPYPAHVPGRLRGAVVRRGQPARRRRLPGHRPSARTSGRPSPLLIAGVALAMLGATFAIRVAQHATR